MNDSSAENHDPTSATSSCLCLAFDSIYCWCISRQRLIWVSPLFRMSPACPANNMLIRRMRISRLTNPDRVVIRRQRMSVEKRFRIIRALDQGMTRNQVIQHFNLKHSSNITTILKNRAAIMREMMRGTRPSAKAIRIHKFPMIDEALIKLMQECIAAGIPVTRSALADKAVSVARKYGVFYRYKKTRGYLDKFLAACDPSIASTITVPVIANEKVVNHTNSTTAHPISFKTRLLQRLRSNSVLFLQHLGRMLSNHAVSEIVHHKVEHLLHELKTSLENVLTTLQNLIVTDDVLIEITSDLMRHHFALTSILISNFYADMHQCVSQGQTTKCRVCLTLIRCNIMHHY